MADKEYIERFALIAEYDRVHIGAAGGARKLMVDAPAVDAVEVVRCKECKNYNTEGCSDGWGWCESSNSGTHDNRYCSDGKRKE